VPFTLVHAGKYRTEEELKIDKTETKHTQKKQTTHDKVHRNNYFSCIYITKLSEMFLLAATGAGV